MDYKTIREKREFLKAAVLAMTMNLQNISMSARSSRDLVNRASELWDEIIYQTPEADKDN